MSGRDQATAAALARVALACDGAVLGLALAFCAAQAWAKYRSSSAALGTIRCAPTSPITDLSSLLLSPSNDDDPSSSSSDGCECKLVVVRGEVQAKWASGGKNHSALVSQGTGERAVVVQRTQTCLYNEWRGIFGWSFDLHALFARSWKEQQSSTTRTVPFALVEAGQWPHSAFIEVKLDGSTHPLPLTTVYHQLLPVQASSYTFLQAVFGHGYPVALLDEEKILPVGREITAVGLCSLRDGVLEIRPSRELPCFLSDMTKDEMEADLATSTNTLFWSGIFLGAISVGILGYAVVRNWGKWKDWRERRRLQREASAAASAETSMDDESGDIPEGSLCVVCLARQRRSAFIPCGHLVCCPRCALMVERDSSPKCPVCRQSIRSSFRIYDS